MLDFLLIRLVGLERVDLKANRMLRSLPRLWSRSHRQGNERSERVRKLPKLKQIASNREVVQLQVVLTGKLWSFHGTHYVFTWHVVV